MTATLSASTNSTSGYSTAGVLVGRAAVQTGLLALSRSQVAAYDPFTSSDPGIYQLLEFLDSLGLELAAELKTHLQRDWTLTTAGSATSYALPVDYVESVDGTIWSTSWVEPALGPIGAARNQAIVAQGVTSDISLPFRIQGNLLTFPVAPSNGVVITGLYVSRYWVQTALAVAPDAAAVTAATDYVLFDPTLVVLGLKLKFQEAKGFDYSLALAAYERRLEWAKGAVPGASRMSLSGPPNAKYLGTENFNDGGYGTP